jgi:hypothetical protein
MEAQLALPDSFDLTPAGADKRYRLGKFTDPRSVTQELEALPLGAGGRDREMGVIGRDRDAGSVTDDVIGDELPASLLRRYGHNGDAPGRRAQRVPAKGG